MKYLVVCTSGKWQLPIIREAQSQGIVCIAVDENPQAEGFKYADYSIVSDLTNIKFISEEIRKITSEIIGAISFCSDAGIPLAQTLNHEFHCSGRVKFDSVKATSKVIQRQIWAANNLAQPRFEVFSRADHALAYGLTAKMPFVVKPSDSSGSRGVSIVNDSLGLEAAIKAAFQYSRTGEIIVEDFMVGTEYTIEVVADDGAVQVLLITRKIKVSENTRTVSRELRSVSPHNPLYTRISKLAISAFEALGIKNGPGHMEMIVDDVAGPVGLVEAAFRGGGFNLADRLVEVTTGFNLTKSCLVPFQGQRIDLENLGYSPSVLFFYPTQKGKLVEIVGLAEAREIPGVEIEILGVEGDYYQEPTTDGDRLCTIIISASSESALEEKKSRVETLFKFYFEEY
jgi:biotin carboxylase